MNEVADVGIAVLMIAGCYAMYLFAEDFSKRTLNLELLAGHTRKEVYQKNCIKIFLLTGSITIVSLLFGCIKYVFKYKHTVQIKDLGYMLKSFCLIYMLSFSLISFCMIFAVWFYDTAKTLIVTFLFLFVSCYVMAAFVSNASPLYLAYEGNRNIIWRLYPPYLWRWSLNPNLSGIDFVVTLFTAGIWSVIFIEIGYRLFLKKEMK